MPTPTTLDQALSEIQPPPPDRSGPAMSMAQTALYYLDKQIKAHEEAKRKAAEALAKFQRQR